MTEAITAAVAAAAALGSGTALNAQAVEPVFSSNLIVNGATTTDDDRLFVVAQPTGSGTTPQVAEGKGLRDAEGKPVNVHADQLEVSADGAWLHCQPACGGLSRIATRYLDDPSLPETELAAHVERFADTPSTGGTAIDADGTIYLSDTDRSRILAVSTEGKVTTLLADRRLVWVDAMWIDKQDHLLRPAARLNRTAGLNGGANAVEPPTTLYRYPIGAKAVRRRSKAFAPRRA